MAPIARSDPAQEALWDCLEAFADSLALLEATIKDWTGEIGMNQCRVYLWAVRETIGELRGLLLGEEKE